MNEAQLLEKLAATDAYAPSLPVAEESSTPEVAFSRIERRIGMQIETRPREVEAQGRRWRGALAAAAALAVVLVVGAALLLGTRGNPGDDPAATTIPETTSPTTVTTEAAPAQPAPLSESEAMAVMNEHMAAFANGDMATIESTLAPDASVKFWIQGHTWADSVAELRQAYEGLWAMDTVWTLAEPEVLTANPEVELREGCSYRAVQERALFTCQGGISGGFWGSGTIGTQVMHLSLELTPSGIITSYSAELGWIQAGPSLLKPFFDWLQGVHPEVMDTLAVAAVVDESTNAVNYDYAPVINSETAPLLEQYGREWQATLDG